MNRTTFLVDGFNLYHSLIQANRDSSGSTTKWLDIGALCVSYLPIVGEKSGQKAALESIYYFSAPPTHRSMDKQKKHALYLSCLKATGIIVRLGRFKKKDVWCKNCKTRFKAHEEKETDVAIAVKLLEICHLNHCHSVVLVTGDTDLAPAVLTAQRLFPNINILLAFPYQRTNAELAKIATESFSIKLKSCLRNQFPDPLVIDGGKIFNKPTSW